LKKIEKNYLNLKIDGSKVKKNEISGQCKQFYVDGTLKYVENKKLKWTYIT
jgi:hypothetical protein